MFDKNYMTIFQLAIVLLDTQGTFDNQTSMKENTFIFALSTLLSSVQIYNLQDRIQMDDLSNLQVNKK
jgi:atlastin